MTFPIITFSSEGQFVLDIANAFIFSIALIGLFITILQSWLEKKRNREAAKLATEENNKKCARELFKDYLKLALDHPDLSTAKYDKKNKLVADQYDTFVSIMLYSIVDPEIRTIV